MACREKPTTRRTRIVLSVTMWVLIGFPLMVGCWTWFGWWSVFLLAGGIWLTKDDLKERDVFGAVDNVAKARVAVFMRPHNEAGG